jgi:hypothetical protein
MITNTLAIIGWMFLIASQAVPFMMRKRASTFEQKQQSYGVGALLAAVALAFFVSNIIIYFNK